MQQGVLKFSLTVTRENKPVWDDPHLLGSPIGFGMRDLPLFESMHGQSVPGTERGITGLSENFGRQDGIEEPSLINCPCDTDVKDGQLPSSTGWNVSFVVKLMERPKIDWLFEGTKQVNTYS